MLTAAAIDARPSGTARPALAVEPNDSGFRIPPAPPFHGQQSWFPMGQGVRVAGMDIPGLVYVGSPPLTKGRHFEPSLIDPGLPVAEQGSLDVKRGLWLSYSALTPHERRGYLAWLSGGRQHPDIDIRYVFLYFYGLERRALIDPKLDSAASSDQPAIVRELHHLLRTYGDRYSAFATAATSLIYWIETTSCPKRLYEVRAPEFLKVVGTKTYVQVAVGQAIADRVPLGAKLALAWLMADGNTYLREAVKEHRSEFDRIYQDLYVKSFVHGLLPEKPSTRLLLPYRPSSPGLSESPLLLRDIGDVADPSNLTASLTSIKSIVDEATEEIERFVRLLGSKPGHRETLEVLSQLPRQLWGSEPRKRIEEIVDRVNAGPVVIKLSELVGLIDKTAVANKFSALCVSRVLDEAGIAIEHEPTGGRGMKPEQLLVLFPSPSEQEPTAFDTGYRLATVLLAFAVLVGASDGSKVDACLRLLTDRLDAWPDELVRRSVRLRAHLQLLAAEPPTLALLKKRLAEFVEPDMEAFAAISIAAALSAGEPSPATVKVLVRVYKVLGLDPKRVPNDLHSAAAGGRSATDAGFSLDQNRIAALQADSAKVSELLSSVFTGDEPEHLAPNQARDALQQAPAGPHTSLLGLDTAHAEMARQILTQPLWSRSDLGRIASARGLMLDGALERINDAAFDAHNIPFAEGEDPVELNPEILEILK